MYEIEVLDGELVAHPHAQLEAVGAEQLPLRAAQPAVQTAMAVATGFVAGAATMALLRRYGQARLERVAAASPAAGTAAPKASSHVHRARPSVGVTVETRVEVRPIWPFRLTRRSGMDG